MGAVGKAISKVTETVSKVAETVSKVAGGIAEIGGKALEFLKTPVSKLIEPVAKFVGEKVGSLPFVGKFLGPMAENLLKQGATSLLGEGPLGGIGFLAKLAPKLEDVVKVAESVKKAADKVDAFAENPLGLQNFQNIIAQNHARFVE
ncbi:hypothetical protein HPC49_00045 [Pyxidicoccus fallax]|uniref:Uncharacterized protein n=1 Tax=Pyxidicoccus fallax TaxID=394095 RepID=A0A848L5Q8_9BACT|nr:hypothetical protein [Pyxidicoccus fallax]NMO14024.1 hypothetical protein [Pyxidicoccus fallax]NPC76644.1 hypothetical protein [Pyxidicoccus fallax]